MKQIQYLFASCLLLFATTSIYARPLLTEEATTSGRLAFDANIDMSMRRDTFGTPETHYQTVRFPWQARLGLNHKLDVGIMLDYVSQRLEVNGNRYTGSANELFSAFFKYIPWDHAGFMMFWHTRHGEQSEQELPISRGHDIEALFLYSIPTKWPLSFNAGYIYRDSYSSKFGISAGQPINIHPGNIIEVKGSVQTPLPAHFSILSELAYYNFQRETLNQSVVKDSAGNAMDALVGISWDYQGWYLGGGVALGLLDEQHTSFDINRGAGNVTYRLRVGYKLLPHRPLQ